MTIVLLRLLATIITNTSNYQNFLAAYFSCIAIIYINFFLLVWTETIDLLIRLLTKCKLTTCYRLLIKKLLTKQRYPHYVNAPAQDY